MVDHPRRQLVPLLAVAAVDGDAVLSVLVLRLGEVVEELGGELGEVAAVDGVVGLEEHLAQLRLAERVVPVDGSDGPSENCAQNCAPDLRRQELRGRRT